MQRPISELLSAYAKGEKVEDEIYAHYYRLARSAAQKQIGRSIQSLVDRSDIANMSLKSALSDLASGTVKVLGNEEFKRHLLAIVNNKARSEARWHTAAKRSAHRQAADADVAQLPSPRELAPDQAAIVNEEIERFLYQFLPEQDPLGQAIGYRFFIDGLSVQQIHDWLEALSKATGTMVIKPRAIQLRIQRMRARLIALVQE